MPTRLLPLAVAAAAVSAAPGDKGQWYYGERKIFAGLATYEFAATFSGDGEMFLCAQVKGVQATGPFNCSNKVAVSGSDLSFTTSACEQNVEDTKTDMHLEQAGQYDAASDTLTLSFTSNTPTAPGPLAMKPTTDRPIACPAAGPAPPPPTPAPVPGSNRDAGTARWLVAHTNYGVISTTDSRGSTAGAAYGGVNSHSDGTSVANSTGRIFWYVSLLDGSAQDTAKHPKASFSVSQLQTNATGCGGMDPEDPTCARVTFSGTVVNVTDNATLAFARAALYAKHPAMKQWPPDHNFLFQELLVEDVFLLDYYGGAKNITPAEYYAQEELVAPRPASVPVPLPFPSDAAPDKDKKAERARWLVHQATWGVVSTTSVHLKGTAFGGVTSFSDGVGLSAENATGRLFFYLSTLDVQYKDFLANPIASLTVSDASLPFLYQQGKQQECAGADPEDPTCARITFTGNMTALPDGADKELAQGALFSKHPQMSQWPGGHGFVFHELKVESIFFLDNYGGSVPLSAADYYNAKL